MSGVQATAGRHDRDVEGDSEYVLTDGIFMPCEPVRHHEDEYDERA